MPKRRRQHPETDWRHRAACRGMEINLFFPVSSAGVAAADITEAKRVCDTCPVQQDCLRLANDLAIDDGIWGGLTETERRSTKSRPGQARLSYYR